jgi:NAD(P)-dependent dehydrogenase (short-subunit alcohol dehydrogenase family)
MKSFKNKICVVTGAGSGIGRSLALALAKDGAKVAISDINEANLNDTVALMNLPKSDVLAKTVDVANLKQVEQFAADVKKKFKGTDLVINNAGVALSQTVEDTEYEDFEWLMGVNFWGVVYGTKSFLPMLKESDDAAVVNISSVFGLVGIPTQGAYNASKFAVKGYTEALRLELKNTNITPITVHPGGIKTNIVNNARFRRGANPNESKDDMVKRFNQLTFTTPDKAAETILNGVKKKQLKVLIGKDAYLFDWAGRWLPQSYHRIVNAIIRPNF